MAYDDEIVSQIRLRAVDETGDVMRGMSQRISDTTSAFAKLGTALGGSEIIRRSYMQFAELTQTLEQVKFATQASDKQMAELAKTIDAVGKQTGRSSNEIATSFRTFFTETGQQLGPAMMKTFETIAQASTITGASVENLSRTAAAAMNNMKVPADQIDILVKKWAVELPDALEGFSAKAPQIMATAQALGFGGIKNAEELGNLTAIMNRTFGQTRISASVLDNLLNQMRNTSTQFGREMTASMMEVKERGGDLNDVFTEMFKRFDAIKDAPPFALDRMGLTPQLHQGLQALEDGFRKIIERIKSGEEPTKAWNDELGTMNKGPMSAVNELKASIENLELAVGKLLQSFGANQAIKDFIDQLDSFRRIADDISEGEYSKAFKEAVRPLNGPIPGEEHPAEPGPQASPYSGSWQGNALSRPGIAIWNALRGMSRGGKAPPKMAEGGIVTEPTFAEIGEAGPEAVVPLGGNSSIGRDTQENTSATKDNTTALNRIASYMRDTSNHRGIYTNAAYTPGAGEAPTPSSAGLYGGGGGHHGASGSWGDNSGSGNSALQGQVPRSFGSGGHYGGSGASGSYGHGNGSDGDGAPGSDGSTIPPSGNLASQRAGFMKELEADPQLRDFAIDAMQHEGGIQSNMEQLFNYAAMRHMTVRQALRSGQYGPVNTHQISGRISALTRAKGMAALKKVGGGSNITDYATDQGMAGDPNFSKYMANRSYYNMHKVEGAWFSSHGEAGRRWAMRQREADSRMAGSQHSPDAKYDTQTGELLGGLAARFGTFSPSGVAGDRGTWGQPENRSNTFNERFGTFSPDGQQHTDKNQWGQPRGDSFDERFGRFSPSGTQGPQGWGQTKQPMDTARERALQKYQEMRDHMEKPIKMSIEAPNPPPLYTYRQRMARQQSRYQSDDQLGAPRYASHMDIGFA